MSTICPVCGAQYERGIRHDCPGPLVIRQAGKQDSEQEQEKRT